MRGSLKIMMSVMAFLLFTTLIDQTPLNTSSNSAYRGPASNDGDSRVSIDGGSDIETNEDILVAETDGEIPPAADEQIEGAEEAIEEVATSSTEDTLITTETATASDTPEVSSQEESERELFIGIQNGKAFGYNMEGKYQSCSIEESTSCTEEMRPQDRFKIHCEKLGHTSFQCGCHKFLCSEAISFSIEEIPNIEITTSTSEEEIPVTREENQLENCNVSRQEESRNLIEQQNQLLLTSFSQMMEVFTTSIHAMMESINQTQQMLSSLITRQSQIQLTRENYLNESSSSENLNQMNVNQNTNFQGLFNQDNLTLDQRGFNFHNSETHLAQYLPSQEQANSWNSAYETYQNQIMQPIQTQRSNGFVDPFQQYSFPFSRINQQTRAPGSFSLYENGLNKIQ